MQKNYKIKLGTQEIEITQDEDGKFIKPLFIIELEKEGTALKPAVEPIVVARKPLSEKNVALNVLKWGTGGINIDECRIPTNEVLSIGSNNHSQASVFQHNQILNSKQNELGRFPANIILEKSYQQLYTLKESFINLIPLLNQYYGNYYMFKLQEKISNLQEQNKGQSWKVLSEEMLLQMDERKEKSNGRQETQEGINTKDDREKEEYSKRKEQQEIQRVLDEQGIQVSQQRRINSPTENMGESDDQENRNPRTQDSYGDTSQQTIKDFGDSPSQEWSEERQQNRESGDDGKLNTQERTQRDIKRIKAITKGERGFIVCDCDLPKEWRDFFEPTIIEIDYPFSSAKMLDEETEGKVGNGHWSKTKTKGFGEFGGGSSTYEGVGEKDKVKGGASRFFYCAKASKSERNLGCDELEEKIGGSMEANITETMQLGGASLKGEPKQIQPTKNNHPTVKPVALMEYLIKLVSRENAIVLDPFLGSGTTAIACLKTNRKFIGIEKEPEYIKIAQARIKPYLEQTKL